MSHAALSFGVAEHYKKIDKSQAGHSKILSQMFLYDFSVNKLMKSCIDGKSIKLFDREIVSENCIQYQNGTVYSDPPIRCSWNLSTVPVYLLSQRLVPTALFQFIFLKLEKGHNKCHNWQIEGCMQQTCLLEAN